jgi:hypothetical protein
MNYAHGIRTWNLDHTSRDGFKWDLTPYARTEAPDWIAEPFCGNGLHACRDYSRDLQLAGLADKLIGMVRWDADLEIHLGNGKIKAPWMEFISFDIPLKTNDVFSFRDNIYTAACAVGNEGHSRNPSGLAVAAGFASSAKGIRAVAPERFGKARGDTFAMGQYASAKMGGRIVLYNPRTNDFFSGIVDGYTLKPDTIYEVINGKPEPVC